MLHKRQPRDDEKRSAFNTLYSKYFWHILKANDYNTLALNIIIAWNTCDDKNFILNIGVDVITLPEIEQKS